MNEDLLKDCFDTENEKYQELMELYAHSADDEKKCMFFKFNKQKHHRIPKCYFELNGLQVDNSEDNLICLSLVDHIKAHCLMAYCVKDKRVKFLMYVGALLLRKDYEEKHTEKSLEYWNIKCLMRDVANYFLCEVPEVLEKVSPIDYIKLDLV